MGMKKKTGIREQSIPDKKQLSEANSNEAGNSLANAIGSTKGIEWESRDIALSDIRTNDDNAIFRELDDEDDIRRLAEDIKRNGLLHNLVVFPQEEEGKTVYVLLSGERRYRAMAYLEKRGDATWNTVRHCQVITNKDLSENEKKVLLYSANLQVRGGFADESIRRKATAEFVKCLQQEPYKLTEAQAKKALKEQLPPQARKTSEKDLRIEDDLNKGLLELLDSKFLTRRECEFYVSLDEKQQESLYERFAKLNAVDTAHSAELQRAVDAIYHDYRKEVEKAKDEDDLDSIQSKINDANKLFDEIYPGLEKEAASVAASYKNDNKDDANEEKEAKEKKPSRRVSSGVSGSRKSVIQRRIPALMVELNKYYDSDTIRTRLKKTQPDEIANDIKALDDLSDVIEKMKALLKEYQE